MIRQQTIPPLHWRHNGCDGVSNRQPHEYLLKRLFSRRSKKTSKLRVTSLCAGNSPLTCELSAQKASNAENASIWWRHHAEPLLTMAPGCHIASLGPSVLNHSSDTSSSKIISHMFTILLTNHWWRKWLKIMGIYMYMFSLNIYMLKVLISVYRFCYHPAYSLSNHYMSQWWRYFKWACDQNLLEFNPNYKNILWRKYISKCRLQKYCRTYPRSVNCVIGGH